MTYIKINEYIKAQDDCYKAISIDDKLSKSHYHISKCLMILGNIQEALNSINIAVELDKSNQNCKTI